MNVPSAVAMSVENSAITSEFFSAVARSGLANGCAQWSSVKPCQVKLKRPLFALNENRTTMKIGMNRYSSASADHAPSSHVRVAVAAVGRRAGGRGGDARDGGGCRFDAI